MIKLYIVAETKNGIESRFQFIHAETISEAQGIYNAINGTQASKAVARKNLDGTVEEIGDDKVDHNQLCQLIAEPLGTEKTPIPCQS